MALTPEVRERRERLVREHMESENRHAFDVTLATFHHPRYEIVPTGDVYDGEAQVASYYEETRAAFPDQRNELIALHHADDAVIVEFDLKGRTAGATGACPRPGARSTVARSRSSSSMRTGWSVSAPTSIPPASCVNSA